MPTPEIVVPYQSPAQRAFGRAYKASVIAIATLLLTGTLGIVGAWATGLVVDPKLIASAAATLFVNTILLALEKWRSANADEPARP